MHFSSAPPPPPWTKGPPRAQPATDPMATGSYTHLLVVLALLDECIKGFLPQQLLCLVACRGGGEKDDLFALVSESG